MFNVGGPEVLVILLVALIALGPAQLPKAARQVGQVMAEIRKVSSGFQRELTDAFDLESKSEKPEKPQSPGGPQDVAPPSDDLPDAGPGSRRRRSGLSADRVSATDEAQELTGGHMSLIEHLTELRSRLIKCVIAVAVGAVIVWIFYDPILTFLKAPLDEADPNARLILTDPLQGLATRFKVSGYGGIALATPVLLWQLWKFITPGLYPKERRYAVPFVASGVVLFIMGASLAYWTLPRALAFLISIGGPDIEAFYTPDKYIQLIVYMMLAFGLGFEFPIVLVFLQLVGVLSYKRLISWRRYAIIGIVVLVAVITPSGDPISLAALSVPMYLFYELSILIGWLITRRRVHRRDVTEAFTLDPFQQQAVAAIDRGESVLVAAPTGAGKTVVAEHAVERVLAEPDGRVFYTTPVKALSNQKYGDLVRRHGPDRIGLLTGDNSINGDARVVVMTTEVLRNMIYAGRPLDDLRFVVLDEVHYLQDAYRGPVWEEVIIHVPGPRPAGVPVGHGVQRRRAGGLADRGPGPDGHGDRAPPTGRARAPLRRRRRCRGHAAGDPDPGR